MTLKAIVPGMFAVAASVLLISSCKPRHTVAPLPDTELQSSVDASFALFRITDAEMVGAFITGINEPVFYEAADGSGGNVPLQLMQGDDINWPFDHSNIGTNSADGAYREGTVYMARSVDATFNPLAGPNSIYYRRKGFAGRMTLGDYLVDGWHINTTRADYTGDGLGACVILNQMTSDTWDPATTNISWSIKGSFKIEKDSKVMYCTVDLVKTLLNTSDPAVYPRASTATGINWPLAKVSYSGKVTGITFNKQAFTMTIDQDKALLRDFTCSPDAVINVTSNGSNVSGTHSEFHPFKDGVAYLTVGDLYQREIYYGGSETVGKGQCDNSGSIAIKGISYPVDFQK